MEWKSHQSLWIGVNDIRLECRCWGPPPATAPTIILLHEGLGSVAGWKDFPEQLTERTGFGVFAYSRAGSLPPMVSQNYGAGKMDRVEQAYQLATRFILSWQMLVYVVLAAGASLIAGIFSDDAEVISAIRLFVWIMPLGYGFQGFGQGSLCCCW